MTITREKQIKGWTRKKKDDTWGVTFSLNIWQSSGFTMQDRSSKI
jgi:predicted GIY-YIG superfamily endonuclease